MISPIIHEAITLNPDPTEFMPIEVNSAFPAGAKSNLNAQEKAQIDKFIEAVPDENDTLAINYWRDMDDRKVYLEGWIDQCLTGTGFPSIGSGDWDDKIEYMVRGGHRTLIEKQEERNRPYIGPGHWPLIEGGFREFEAGDRGWLYGVTWGVYEKSKSGGANPMMIHRGTDTEAIKVAERFGLVFDGMMEAFYQFTVAKGPEKAKGITFYVKDLSQVEARLHEKLKEFGIEEGNPTGSETTMYMSVAELPEFRGKAWRAESGYSHAPGTTIADIIRFEREELGNEYPDISDELLKELDRYSAKDAVWVNRRRKDCLHYLSEGESEEAVGRVHLPEDTKIITPDYCGGYLVLVGSETTSNPMITDVDTALKDVADWYVDNRRDITEPELETILLKHCGSEAEALKFAAFLDTEPGQLRFKTLLRERKGG